MLTKFKSVILVLGLFVYLLRSSFATICELKPKGAEGEPIPVGTKYRIVIKNNPEKYIPGQTYNVILQGKSRVIGEPNTFNRFVLTVEPSERNDDLVAMGPLAAGIFKLLPDEKDGKIDEFCPNTIVHTSLTFIPSVEVLWTAPDPGIGCVIFRASVMEHNFWYRSEGGLELKLCEQESFGDDDARERCCSCNEAKYEMKFEGLWTRQSHPRFYPDNAWLTRFSDVIGASHAYDYRFWKENEVASLGLVEFYEKENTTILESEIKSNRTRTVIKAKGLSHPHMTGKTFAVFRVDQDHHLLSLVSIIRPSPGWFVGISGLSLCEEKCAWTDAKTIDLYPYDFGLYDDVKYESKSLPRKEPLPIHKISQTNEESPFYMNNEDKLKPLAKVYLIKTREYDKECDNPSAENRNPDIRVPPNEGESIAELPAKPPSPETFTRSRPKDPIESDGQLQEKCEQAPRIHSKCSEPKCDNERVRISYRQFDERIKEDCMRLNITAETLERCSRNCAPGKQPASLANCVAGDFPPVFNPCDPILCTRNRTRTAKDLSSKNSRECLNVNWHQYIECQPQDCSRKRKSRRKFLTNKYNVTISASYTYAALHNPELCANSTNSTTG